MTKAIALPQQAKNGGRARDYLLPAAIALACASAAYAGADTTFDPALQKFTDFLEGSGGKIITVRRRCCSKQAAITCRPTAMRPQR